MTNNYERLVQAIDKNPDLLVQLLNNENSAVTRGSSPARGDNAILRGVLGAKASATDLNNINKLLSSNPVVQLFMSAQGSLDAKDLLNYVGGLNGTNITRSNNNHAVRALFDGRLDLKEIMIIIVLMKLFKRKQANTYNNSAIGLLGTLFGYNSVPTTNQGLLGTLFGNNYNSYSGGLFGNNYSNGLFNNQYYQSNNGLGSFLGLYPQQQYSNNQLQNLLNFVNGNYNNNAQYHQLYNILNNAAPHYVNNNGVVSAQGLFNVLNQMMGYRK